jgi:hypothetical protein
MNNNIQTGSMNFLYFIAEANELNSFLCLIP